MFTRWLVLHVGSGQSFFTGAACLIAAVCLSASARRRRFRIARNFLVALGGILVFVSAIPLPPWFYLLLLIASLLWVVGEASGGRVPARLVLGLRVAVIATWLAAVLV